MTEGIFCLLLRQGQKRDKKLEVYLFLARFLVPLALASQPCFRHAFEASIGFTVDLAVNGAKSIDKKVAVGLLR